MFGVFAVIQIILCLLLITVVLLQEGKKGMGAIFGGSSSSIFGARGAANILTKVTTILAILFMLNSVWLAHLSSQTHSVTDQVVQQEKQLEEAKKATENNANQQAEQPQAPKPQEQPQQQ